MNFSQNFILRENENLFRLTLNCFCGRDPTDRIVLDSANVDLFIHDLAASTTRKHGYVSSVVSFDFHCYASNMRGSQLIDSDIGTEAVTDDCDDVQKESRVESMILQIINVEQFSTSPPPSLNFRFESMPQAHANRYCRRQSKSTESQSKHLFLKIRRPLRRPYSV